MLEYKGKVSSLFNSLKRVKISLFSLFQILGNFQFVDKSTSLGVKKVFSSFSIPLVTPEVKGIEMTTKKLRVLLHRFISTLESQGEVLLYPRDSPEFQAGLILTSANKWQDLS